jgi:hypothetical protein
LNLVHHSASALPRRSVLLLVPHRVRDLEGHALLAYHLDRSYGIETHVCNLADFESKLLEVAPDTVVLDYLGWTSKARHAQLARRLGMKVADLPISGLYETNEEHLRSAGELTGAYRFAIIWRGGSPPPNHRPAGLLPISSVTGPSSLRLYRAPRLAWIPTGDLGERSIPGTPR